MEYRFVYKNTPGDLFRLYMVGIYTSLIGTVNIIFIFAMGVLLLKRYEISPPWFHILMVLAFLLFLFFQPALLWIRSCKAAQKAKETDIRFLPEGIQVIVEGKGEKIPWNRVRRYFKKGSTLVFYTDGHYGYILNKRIMGERLREVHQYAQEAVKRNRKDNHQ